MTEVIKSIDSNEEFGKLSSGGVNIPFQYNGKSFSLIIYPEKGTGLTKYTNSRGKWIDGRKFSIDISSKEGFTQSLNKKLSEITLGNLQKLNQNYLDKTYQYIHDKGVIITSSREEIQNSVQESSNKIEYISDKEAKFQYNGDQINFRKLQKGITVLFRGSSETFYYENINQLNIRLGGWLDQQIGKTRNPIRNYTQEIWNRLHLQESTGKKEFSPNTVQSSGEVTIQRDIFSYDVGEYMLEDNPLKTYLLVRNHNSGEYYCLSFVQEAYDIIFGKGSAKKVGLYDSLYAEGLDFSGKQNVKVYDSNFPELKPGMIIRMGSPMTHIGIVLPNGKIGHIVGDKFYIDESISKISWGAVSQVIEPLNIPIPRILLKSTQVEYKKGLTLERVGYLIKKDMNASESINEAYVEEAIFQHNKGKFSLKEMRNSALTVELNENTKLQIPSNW